jgi:hypothetical protein
MSDSKPDERSSGRPLIDSRAQEVCTHADEGLGGNTIF